MSLQLVQSLSWFFAKLKGSKMKKFLYILLALLSINSFAGTVFRVPIRDGVDMTVFWEPAKGATATVLLLPGGGGGFGRLHAVSCGTRQSHVAAVGIQLPEIAGIVFT